MAQFIVKAPVVANCLDILRDQKVHNTFAGYLCVRRTAFSEGRRDNLQVNFKEFFDTFFRVSGAPPRKPYVLPFWDSPASESNKWFNQNVAGSYAPSSLRSDSPFLKVVGVEGARKPTSIRYSLFNDDAKLAQRHLLYGTRLPALALAAFLYRDFAIEADEPSTNLLVEVFLEEFGFLSGPKKSLTPDYHSLFFFNRDDRGDKSDLFEAV